MGGAMLEGWLKLDLGTSRIAVLDPYISRQMVAICSARGVRVNPPVTDLYPAETLVLAIKPQSFETVAPGLADIVDARTLLMSIMAGKTIADIAARLPVKAIVRAMPNTPASVGRGITGAAASAAVSPEQRAMASALLQAIGSIEWVDREELINAVTAVSGSGPAYVFYLVECMAAAGVAAGLPEDIAMRLARATVEGSGELLFCDSRTSAQQLRVNVTSPGGTTAAALEVLMADDGLALLIERAILAAKRRAEELAG